MRRSQRSRSGSWRTSWPSRPELETLKECVAHEGARLRQLVEGHAPVEPGRLQVEVRESTHQRISKAFLVSVLGQADYEAMRAEAPPTVYRRLVVGERARESTSTRERGAKNHGVDLFVKKDRP